MAKEKRKENPIASLGSTEITSKWKANWSGKKTGKSQPMRAHSIRMGSLMAEVTIA